MWEKVKKVLKWLAAPVLFLAGLVVGRNFLGRNDNGGAAGEVETDLDRTAGLVSRASVELGELREAVEGLKSETGVTAEQLRDVKSRLEQSGKDLDKLGRSLDEFRGTSEQIAVYARRYDELSSESAAILEELFRRAGETDFFAEETERFSMDSDGIDSIFGCDCAADQLKETE